MACATGLVALGGPTRRRRGRGRPRDGCAGERRVGAAGPSQAKYLNQTLAPQGTLLTNYFGIGHVSQGNYVAMMSGQPLSNQTQGDCQKYNEFVQTGTVDSGAAVGDGCIYPASVQTLPDQLKAKGLVWKAYMEDMGNTPTREEATCGRPLLGAQVAVGQTDGTQTATATDQYAARHNPFVSFHSLVDTGDCAKYRSSRPTWSPARPR